MNLGKAIGYARGLKRTDFINPNVRIGGAPFDNKFQLTERGPRRPKSAEAKCGDASKVRGLLRRLEKEGLL